MYAQWRGTEGRLPESLKLRQSLGDAYPEIEKKLRQSRGSYAGYLWNSSKIDLLQVLSNEESISQIENSAEILAFLQVVPCSPDCVTEQDFHTYWPTHGTNSSTLPNRLALMMWDYHLKKFRNDMNGFHAANGLPQIGDYLSPDHFEEIHGPKPWDLLNSIIDGFSGIKYKVSSPEGVDPFGSFALKLVDKVNPKIEINFASLSSGEKTMLALAGILYKGSTGGKFPKLVLLDEVDASLHPSMVSALIRVVEEVLIPRGTKVVLVTHSPTTVALAPEISLYEMSPLGPNRIRKIERGTAVSLLTEGFATLEQGLTIFNEAASYKVSIITEGKNNALISKALGYFGLEKEIGVLRGMDGRTGKDQIDLLFDFFAGIPHKLSQVVCLMDPDVKPKIPPERGDTYWIILPENRTNAYAPRGIENCFDPKLLEGFLIDRWDDKKGEAIKKFDPHKKTEFVEFICARGVHEDFSWFEPIAIKLKELIGRTA